jgi:HEAT repeat protein
MVRDPDPAVRVVALGSLSKAGALTVEVTVCALADSDWRVRRRACEVAARVASGDTARDSARCPDDVVAALVSALGDREPLVAESAAWALGELVPPFSDDERAAPFCPPGPVDVSCALFDMAMHHRDPLCREAAVAAIGAIGDPSSLDAVLAALGDKPPVRRRAVVALAAFDEPRADEALQSCLTDRDWQVRQAAEDLRPRPGTTT